MLGRKGSLWARAERGGAPLVIAVIVVRHGALVPGARVAGQRARRRNRLLFALLRVASAVLFTALIDFLYGRSGLLFNHLSG